MKFMVFSCLVVTLVATCYADNTYTTKYDNVDLDQILNSDRLLKNYLNCLLDKGKCTPDGLELKKNLPDSIKDECAKCTEKQKKGANKVVVFLIKNKRDWWNEVAAKYDPEGIYTKRYEEEIKRNNLKI